MRRVISFFICVFTVLTLFASCDESKKTKTFFAMDTVIQVTLYGGGSSDFDSIQSEVENAENKYSATKSDSLVYKLNNGESVNRDQGLLEMLALAKKMTKESNGAYDVTVRPIMKLYGFGGETRVPTDEELKETLKKVGFDGIDVTDDGIRLSSGVEIDLGSCAKGYAGDKAIEYLRSSDVEYAVLSLGGSVHTYGKKPNGELFTIDIADPNNPSKIFASVDVGECAVVTSGVYQRYFESDGVRYHHLIDATTGKCSESDLLSITVIIDYQDMRAGMKADILSTGLFLLGSDGALEYHRKEGGFEAVMVTASGDVIVTNGLKDKFSLSGDSGYTLKNTVG